MEGGCFLFSNKRDLAYAACIQQEAACGLDTCQADGKSPWLAVILHSYLQLVSPDISQHLASRWQYLWVTWWTALHSLLSAFSAGLAQRMSPVNWHRPAVDRSAYRQLLKPVSWQRQRQRLHSLQHRSIEAASASSTRQQVATVLKSSGYSNLQRRRQLAK